MSALSIFLFKETSILVFKDIFLKKIFHLGDMSSEETRLLRFGGRVACLHQYVKYRLQTHIIRIFSHFNAVLCQ